MGVRPNEGYAGPQARDDLEVEVAEIGLEIVVRGRERFIDQRIGWRAEVGLRGKAGPHGDLREAHAGRQHADYRRGIAAQAHRPARDLGVALKESLPAFVADDHDTGRALDSVGSDKIAAQDGLDTENAEEIGRSPN